MVKQDEVKIDTLALDKTSKQKGKSPREDTANGGLLIQTHENHKVKNEKSKGGIPAHRFCSCEYCYFR